MDAKGTLELRVDSHDPTRTVVVYNGFGFVSLSWQKCDEIAKAFRKAGQSGRHYAEKKLLLDGDAFLKGSLEPFELRVDQLNPENTLMIVKGVQVASIPWQVCRQISASFTIAARKGEEQFCALQVIADDALLIRTGAPFAFSDDPRKRDVAYNDAQWDPAARRRVPLRGIPSPRRVGTPKIVRESELGESHE